MKMLEEYFDLQNKIFEYFGYKENWTVIPFDDATEYFWKINDLTISFGEKASDIGEIESKYTNEIYTNRHLNKYVYRGKDYTMVYVDTHTDDNKFLQVFSNKKELVK